MPYFDQVVARARRMHAAPPKSGHAYDRELIGMRGCAHALWGMCERASLALGHTEAY
jgi:hypothetical protein